LQTDESNCQKVYPYKDNKELASTDLVGIVGAEIMNGTDKGKKDDEGEGCRLTVV
jgi:hypothetical protein